LLEQKTDGLARLCHDTFSRNLLSASTAFGVVVS